MAKRTALTEGKPGESLFWMGMFDLTSRENELPELFRKVKGMSDHRLLAIVTALIVEDRLDKILSSFLPRYSVFEKTDFTFSMKIRLLEALNFIPPLITAAAHCLREIRNEFAHHLEFTKFSELGSKVQTKLRVQRATAYEGMEKPDRPEGELHEAFHELSFFCIACLDSYTVNVRLLREHLDHPSFVKRLHDECRLRTRNVIDEVIRQQKTNRQDGSD